MTTASLHHHKESGILAFLILASFAALFIPSVQTYAAILLLGGAIYFIVAEIQSQKTFPFRSSKLDKLTYGVVAAGLAVAAIILFYPSRTLARWAKILLVLYMIGYYFQAAPGTADERRIYWRNIVYLLLTEIILIIVSETV